MQSIRRTVCTSQSKEDAIRTKIEALTEDDINKKMLLFAEKYKRKVLLLRFIEKIPQLRLLWGEEIKTFVDRNMGKSDNDTVNDLCANILSKISVLRPEELTALLVNESECLNKVWNDNTVLKLCPGKDLFKEIHKWTSDDYNISFSTKDIIDYMEFGNIDLDIKDLIQKILNVSCH